MNANKQIIHPSSILISNGYVCISIPICDWRLICANSKYLRLYNHNAMDISVLWLRSNTGNKNTVIHIWTHSRVIKHTRNISILYARRVYNFNSRHATSTQSQLQSNTCHTRHKALIYSVHTVHSKYINIFFIRFTLVLINWFDVLTWN